MLCVVRDSPSIAIDINDTIICTAARLPTSQAHVVCRGRRRGRNRRRDRRRRDRRRRRRRRRR